jgi:hypothetical protein
LFCVGLSFFNFEIDYFSLIPRQVFDQQIKILFYYHEGDNPYSIKQRLDGLCQIHNLNTDCYRFVSGNTVADNIANFVWFPDHELLYWHRNKSVAPSPIHVNPRPYLFTALNRTHKWWRATVMTDLEQLGLLKCSQWSYNTAQSAGDLLCDNPIYTEVLLQCKMEKFMRLGPYACDQLTPDQHNDHHLHVAEHYTQSYCNLVIETHFDADQSGGAFLTEKTFKPIKHGQPFVIIGTPGSLKTLRNLGYKTFDHAIDNRYDLEPDSTRRWQLIKEAIIKIAKQNPDQWFASCLDDIAHNQKHFLASKYLRLNTLYDKLLH